MSFLWSLRHLLCLPGVLAVACAPALIVTPEPAEFVSHFKPLAGSQPAWHMVQHGEFPRAEQSLAALPLDSTTAVAAAQGMLDVYHGNYGLAADRLQRVVHSRADSLLRRFAYYGLEAVFASEERYPALETLETWARSEGLATDSTSYLTARLMAGVGPMRITRRARTTVLYMEKTIAGSPAAAVSVNGAPDENFWFDTGASLSVIDDVLARRAHVRIVSEMPGSAGTATERKVSFRLGVIDSLVIGDLIIHNVPVAVMRGQDLSMGIPLFRIPGIIGWPIIARVQARFDYPGRRVILTYPPPVDSGARRNLFFAGVPVVEASVDGSGPLELLLDTGSNGSMLTQAGMDKLVTAPQVVNAAGCIGGAGGGGAKSLKITRASTIVVDHESVYPLNLQLHELPTKEVPITVDGLLGEDVLPNFLVTIDAEHGLVTLQR